MFWIDQHIRYTNAQRSNIEQKSNLEEVQNVYWVQ